MVIIPEHAVIRVPTKEDFFELAEFLKANSKITWNGGRDLLDRNSVYLDKAVRIFGDVMLTDAPVNYERNRRDGQYGYVPEDLFLISIPDFIAHCTQCDMDMEIEDLL